APADCQSPSTGYPREGRRRLPRHRRPGNDASDEFAYPTPPAAGTHHPNGQAHGFACLLVASGLRLVRDRNVTCQRSWTPGGVIEPKPQEWDVWMSTYSTGSMPGGGPRTTCRSARYTCWTTPCYGSRWPRSTSNRGCSVTGARHQVRTSSTRI